MVTKNILSGSDTLDFRGINSNRMEDYFCSIYFDTVGMGQTIASFPFVLALVSYTINQVVYKINEVECNKRRHLSTLVCARKLTDNTNLFLVWTMINYRDVLTSLKRCVTIIYSFALWLTISIERLSLVSIIRFIIIITIIRIYSTMPKVPKRF